jgi:hypothetical protein
MPFSIHSGAGAPFKKMIKELLQAPRMILLIDPLARPVLLAFIAEHVERSGGVPFCRNQYLWDVVDTYAIID